MTCARAQGQFRAGRQFAASAHRATESHVTPSRWHISPIGRWPLQAISTPRAANHEARAGTEISALANDWLGSIEVRVMEVWLIRVEAPDFANGSP